MFEKIKNWFAPKKEEKSIEEQIFELQNQRQVLLNKQRELSKQLEQK